MIVPELLTAVIVYNTLPTLDDLKRLPDANLTETTLRRGLELHGHLVAMERLVPRDRKHHRTVSDEVLARLTCWALLQDAQGDDARKPPCCEGSAPLVYERQQFAVFFWHDKLQESARNRGVEVRLLYLDSLRGRIGRTCYKEGKMPEIPKEGQP